MDPKKVPMRPLHGPVFMGDVGAQQAELPGSAAFLPGRRAEIALTLQRVNKQPVLHSVRTTQAIRIVLLEMIAEYGSGAF
jgi:hypothetical protein